MKFYIYTLGCKVNLYESNVMRDKLQNAGYRLVSPTEKADIYIINTCSVTNTADHKSIKMIHQAVNKNKEAIIIVTGCLSQHEEKTATQIEGVDIVIGNKNKSRIVTYIEEYQQTHQKKIEIFDLNEVAFEPMQLNNFDKTRAFVKIQDGCRNFCSYCIIPYTRGTVRSKNPKDVLNEVNLLVQSGHIEVVLTGIHTGNYGVELKQYDFADLLSDLIKIEGLKQLRISSIEVTELNDRVLNILEQSSILVDHLHIPLQSGCDEILTAMNRKYDVSYFADKIKQIRQIRPHISITTDVIVGFPGETDEHFLKTIETIRQIQFSKLHVFPYSKRAGTVAADMTDQVAEDTKKERVHRLLKLSKELEENYMRSFLGKERFFLPEVWKDGFLIGHTGNYLQVKMRGEENQLYQLIPVVLEQLEYPYLIATEREKMAIF